MNAETGEPRVGCGAAIVRGDQLLLVRRRRDPEAGCWGLPGGKVDPFETTAHAAAREVREELGIVIEPTELLCLVELIDRTKGHHWVAPIFLIDEFDGVPSIMEPDALSDLSWFGIDTLPAPLTQAARVAAAAMQGPRARRPSAP